MLKKVKKHIKKHHSLFMLHFTSKDFFSIFVLVGVSIGIPIIIYVNSAVYKEVQFGKLMADAKSPTSVSSDADSADVEILSNELLVKIRKNSKNKISENAQNTGISVIDEIGNKYGISKFEKIAKQGKKSNTDSDVFSWYLVRFEGENINIKAKIDKKTGELKKTDAKTTALAEKIHQLQNDPDIEDAEPNFIISLEINEEKEKEEKDKSNKQTDLQTLESTGIEATDSPTLSPTQAQEPTPSSAPSNIPNDPYYSSSGSWGQTYDDLYGLKKIKTEGAWAQTTGSSDIVVADIDTGVDRNHEDLTTNMWVNTAETPGNSIDDDGNGYIDDYYGWDFANGDNDPMDDHGHGTHTAGTIAAVGNNSLGVVGVSWNAKIMALKFLTSSGSGYTSNAIKALQYAADNGARISSNSWGSSVNSTAVDDAIKYEHDRNMVVVVAAGNSNIDALDHSPASCDGAITVSASDYNDAKASFSNWGSKIDVAAPGVEILSTRAAVNPMCTSTKTVGTNYCRVSGTSMATPHVSGLAALLLSKNPALSNEEVRQILRYSADDIGASGKDMYFGYGRINAEKTINNASLTTLSPLITSPRTRTAISASTVDVLGTASGANFASYKVEYGAGRTPTSWTTVTQSNTPITNSTLASIPTSSLAPGSNTIRVIAYDNTGQEFAYQVHDITLPTPTPTATPIPTTGPTASPSEPPTITTIAYLNFPYGFISKGNIDIYGAASISPSTYFSNRKLEWGVGENPSTWSTEGITQASTPVLPKGKMGVWNTTNLIAGQTYTLKLTVTSTTGDSTIQTAKVVVDADLVSNWPKYSQVVNGYYWVPVFADIDNNGDDELISLGTDDTIRQLIAYRKDGSTIPGFPVSFAASNYPNPSAGSVAIDDIDNDGKKEIVIPILKTLDIIRSDGSRYPGWPKTLFAKETELYDDRTPILVDLDNDNVKEIVVMEQISTNATAKTADFKLHAYKLSGYELSGFPKTYTFPIVSSLASGHAHTSLSSTDVDGDGKPELTFGLQKNLYLFDNTGNIIQGWPFTAPVTTKAEGNENAPMVFSSPASFGDVNGDGVKEIVALTTFNCTTSRCNRYIYRVYAFNRDGSPLSGWPQSVTAYVGSYEPSELLFQSPTMVDYDRDGKDEAIVAVGRIYGVGDSGIEFSESLHTLQGAASVAVADVDGDGQLNFSSLFAQNASIISPDGSVLWSRLSDETAESYERRFDNPGILADMDKDGKMEFGVQSTTPQGYVHSSIYLWQIPKLQSGSPSGRWSMYMGNPARTGRLVLDGPLPTAAPTLQPTTGPSPLPTNTPIPTATTVPTLIPSSTPIPTSAPTVPPGTYPTPTGAIGYYTIYGTVYDKSNNSPISGALIEFNERGKNLRDGKLALSTTSDAQGRYSGKIPADKLYTNTVTATGYAKLYLTLVDTVNKSGEIHLFNYPMTPDLPAPTATPAPTKPPRGKNTVKSVRASKIDRTAVTISWSTVEQSTREIHYGTNPNKLNLKSSTGTSLRYTHSLTLKNLRRNTRYFYRVYSKNARGEEVSSPTMTFVTRR